MRMATAGSTMTETTCPAGTSSPFCFFTAILRVARSSARVIEEYSEARKVPGELPGAKLKNPVVGARTV